MALAKVHKDLNVYKLAFEAAMEIFAITKTFPPEERYSLTDQIRRSSRSVCGNIAEAWRKRRYEKLFINKLADAEGEAAETQNWLDFAFACEYMKACDFEKLTEKYDRILGMIVKMILDADKWTAQYKTTTRVS